MEADAEEVEKCLAEGGDVVHAARVGLWGAVPHFLEEDPRCVKNTSDSGWTALHWAADRGHRSTVELLLKHKADVKARIKVSDTALHLAVQHGPIVELLLKHNADVEAKENGGRTALHYAAACGYCSTVELLLKHKAPIEAKTNVGSTALHKAAEHGHNSTVELLLMQNADAEAKDNDGRTALHRAAASGHGSTMELLLKHNAHIEAKDKEGKKPVDAAKTDEIKALLLEAEEEQRSEKEEVAQCKDILDAAEKGLVKAAEHFLRKDPKCVEAKNADGGTALHIAAEKGLEGMIALLLDHGASLEAKDDYGLTALHLAVYCGHVHIVKGLALRNADLDVEENDGKTPAKLAIEQGHSAVEILLQEVREERQKEQADAEEAATCKDGVIQAARDGLLGAVRHLLKEDPECIEKKDRFRRTTLHQAAEKGHGSIVQLLLSQRAAVDSKAIDGLTPLHLAASNGQTSVVKLLVSQGASPDLQGNNGKTPADVAKEKGHEEIVILLRSGFAGEGGESCEDQKPAESRPVEAEKPARECKDSQSSESALGQSASAPLLAVLAGAAGPALLLKAKAEAQGPQPSAEATKAEATPERAQEREAWPSAVDDAGAQSQAALGQGAGPQKQGAGAKEPAHGGEAASMSVIPDGANAPVSMFSARFDGGEMERKFRAVHQLLKDHRFDTLMVTAKGSDDFGVKTLECLGEIRRRHGVMIAVCTANYGEVTDSPYSSNAELRFAFDKSIKVLPLKVVDTYPPRPPGGPGHKHGDEKYTAQTLCEVVFKGSVVYLDCRGKSEEDIAAMIGKELLKM